MHSLFFSASDVYSPRWQQAFPSAKVCVNQNEMPIDLQGVVVWAVLSEEFKLSNIVKWVAAGARVIALTFAEDPRQAKQVLEMGANGYLHYLAAPEVLQQVSHVVELGGLWLGIDLMRQLVFATATIIQTAPIPSSQALSSLALLSVREQDVAKAVAAGKSNKEVARDLDITERTVKAHLSAVFEKLQVRDRLHLVLVLSGR